MTRTVSDGKNEMPMRRDLRSFIAWEPGKAFDDRLRFDDVEINEDAFRLHFWSPKIGKGAVIQADTHLMLRYANESANFLEFGQLPIGNHRMWVSDSSDWLKELSIVSRGVFDDVSVRHYLFVFSNASIDVICLGEPNITIKNS